VASNTVINTSLQTGNNTVINDTILQGIQITPGTLICDKYSVVKRLEVNSGEADLFLCSYNGYEYVAKVYRREKAIKKEVANILKSINSEYVAKIYDTGLFNGLPVEVIPYYRNGSLSGHTYSYSALKSYIIPALNEGLKILHDNNIFHKDLKPSNIMLADNNRDVVIIDFGISSVREEGNTMIVTQTGLTPEYIAPEAFRNIYFDITDYYSLGITIFELFYGHNPYANMSREEMEQYVAIQKVPIPDDMPEELMQLITALTYPDITNRNNKLNPNRRWGYDEVCKWCKGEAQIIPGSGQDAGILSGDMNPYKFAGETFTSKTKFVMALAMNWDEGKKQLFRGLMSAHFKGYDQELASVCMDAEEEASANDDLVFMRTLYKIDSQQSFLLWKGKRFINLPDYGERLLGAIHENDTDFINYVYDMLANRVLTEYAFCMGANEKEESVKSLKAVEDRYNHSGKNIADLYLLGYLLSEAKPLYVDDKIFYSVDELIAEVQELAEKNPSELRKFGKKLVPGDGQLETQFNMWLIAFNKQNEIKKWENSIY